MWHALSKARSACVCLALVPALATCAVAHELVAAPQFAIIDVRTAAEWNQGHISCAHGPLDIQDEEAGWEQNVLKWVGGDRTVPVITYCKTGGRAGKAADVLRAANFTNARCGGGYDILADRARLEALCARAPGNATVARRA